MLLDINIIFYINNKNIFIFKYSFNYIFLSYIIIEIYIYNNNL